MHKVVENAVEDRKGTREAQEERDRVDRLDEGRKGRRRREARDWGGEEELVGIWERRCTQGRQYTRAVEFSWRACPRFLNHHTQGRCPCTPPPSPDPGPLLLMPMAQQPQAGQPVRQAPPAAQRGKGEEQT